MKHWVTRSIKQLKAWYLELGRQLEIWVKTQIREIYGRVAVWALNRPDGLFQLCETLSQYWVN